MVEAIDGPLTLNECTHSIEGCPFGENCPIRPVWCDAQSELAERLRNTSFAALGVAA
ncbi:MAG: hypothetical protein C0396_09510 [Anaerolinea sp.]|nr:hypothetical protein [Anaerolinea sp.]